MVLGTFIDYFGRHGKIWLTIGCWEESHLRSLKLSSRTAHVFFLFT